MSACPHPGLLKSLFIFLKKRVASKTSLLSTGEISTIFALCIFLGVIKPEVINIFFDFESQSTSLTIGEYNLTDALKIDKLAESL